MKYATYKNGIIWGVGATQADAIADELRLSRADTTESDIEFITDELAALVATAGGDCRHCRNDDGALDVVKP